MNFLSLNQPPFCHAFYNASLAKRGVYRYLLEDRWAIHCYFGQGELTIGDERVTIKPGMVSITPAGIPSSYCIRGSLSYVYSHFSPRGRDLSHGLTRFLSPGGEIADLMRRGGEQYPLNPCLGRAILWQVLLSLGVPGSGEVVENKPSPAGQARKIIANNLFSPFSLSEFSSKLGVSSTHLNRLFKKETGITVYQYVMQERMKRIEYFITQTDTSLKQIALEAGYEDLQQFNKNCRRYLGYSPRQLRNNSMNIDYKEESHPYA